MASLTAIELGADSCTLVRTSLRGAAIQVSAVETLDPGAFPGADAFTTALKQARRTLKLPRRARVVVWGLADGATRRDVAVQPLLAPLTAAGFKVNRVVSPCNALAALARVKSVRGDGATCWLAINRGGVAIVVVRPGKQLYSYSFAWDSSVGSSGSQARLLQRYSLVAILGPEVKRAMAEAHKHGIAVEAVVTCGNLPDLRSLTMPLIEELDVEVETLDSLDGLVVKPAAAERLAEVAPALRLACAGLIARGTRAWDEKRRQSVRRTGAALRVAAAAALVLGLGYAWYMREKLPAVAALLARATDTRLASSVKPPWKPPAKRTEPSAPAVSGTASAPPALSVPPPAVSDAAKKGESNPKSPESKGAKSVPVSGASTQPASSVAPAPKPNRRVVSAAAASPKPDARTPAKGTAPAAANAPTAAPTSPPPAVSVPAKKSESNPPSVAAAAARAMEIARRPSASTPRAADPAPRAATPAMSASAPAPRASDSALRPSDPAPRAPDPARPAGSGLNTPAVPTDKPEAGRNRPLPALLKDPLPRVMTILVSSDRRFATIDSGQIIGIGDVLGRRVVVAIDERTVVLQEPSGVQIRVGLGGRLVAVGRSDR